VSYQAGEGVRTSPEGPDGIKLGHAVERVPLDRLKPARINDSIYKPVSETDPSIIDVARDIKEKGVLDPLVVTPDDVIVSGHRRRVAAQMAGVETVPVLRINILSTDHRFVAYLTSYNKQRVKTALEQVREEIVRTSPEAAYNALLSHRHAESAKSKRRAKGAGLRVLAPTKAARRSEISDDKRPMLAAVRGILNQYEDYLPMTLRQVHYRLLGKGVLRNAKNPGSLYVNDLNSYKNLSDLLTRARVEGEVEWDSINDTTRPRTDWRVWPNVGDYMRQQMDNVLKGYYRNLLQSQPAYIELVVEKATVQGIAERATEDYCVPVAVSRGYASASSLNDTADRFHASGKDHFVLLIAADLDPEGEGIAATWPACLRDEHGVRNIEAIKVAANPAQVKEYDLSPQPLKQTSSRAAGYEAAYGKNVYELEAFEPDQLVKIIKDAIRNVLDLRLFAEEQRREAEDARLLTAQRRIILDHLRDCHSAASQEGEDEDEDE
jgi:hypothetical protein